MSQKSAIEWTEATWNPVRGCTKVSPGCANCYAETFAERWRGVKGHAYEQGFDLRLVPEKLDEPLRRRKPTTYFVNSMSDLFQDGVPDAFIAEVFAVMAVAGAPIRDWPDADVSFGGTWNGKQWVGRKGPHTFQVLTKRPQRMQRLLSSPKFREDVADAAYRRAHDQRDAGYLHDCISAKACNGYDSPVGTEGKCWPLGNVWLGVSVENQRFADERIPLLLQTPAAVRFLSCEPLIEDLNLHKALCNKVRADVVSPTDTWGPDCSSVGMIDWVIVGGESGSGARPFDLAWARSIVAQCKAAGVAVFVKQLGTKVIDRNDAGFEGDTPTSWPMDTDVEDYTTGVGYQGESIRINLASRKGGDPSEWPADLRVRQMPVTQ